MLNVIANLSNVTFLYNYLLPCVWKYIGEFWDCFSSNGYELVSTKERTTFCCYVSARGNRHLNIDWCSFFRGWLLSWKVKRFHQPSPFYSYFSRLYMLFHTHMLLLNFHTVCWVRLLLLSGFTLWCGEKPQKRLCWFQSWIMMEALSWKMFSRSRLHPPHLKI